jgi:peptidoglycan/LPS O-acetylase OafA/YrhL
MSAATLQTGICEKPDGKLHWQNKDGVAIVLNAKINLGDVSQGRDNNFNLIRFIAATAVLVSHAWPVSLGRRTVEPLTNALGHSLGELSVFVFFALSGFFIASSFNRSSSPFAFITARAARLFPGLAVSLGVVAFVIGPAVTDLPLGAYLSHPETIDFMFRNLTLITPQYTLPGVFTDLPYPRVEGSIWTLFHEVACYGVLFLLGISGLLTRYSAPLLVLALYGISWFAPFEIHPRLIQLQGLSLPFFIGMSFWLWRDKVVLSAPILGAMMVIAGLCRETALAFPTLIFALSYGIFWLGHAPVGKIRLFNRLGDYSYGIYIYAFPLQGLAVWIWGPQSPLENIALSLPMVLLCATASWHWIERPALEHARAGPKKAGFLKRQW